jgi:Short C-terminal domain
MRQLSPAGQQAVSDIAQRQGFSTDAVMHMLDAVVRGNGGMAQFSHPEFSGSGQWMRGGMTMVSDMFNNYLKGRVDGLCSELSALVANQPDLMQAGSFQSQTQGAPAPVVAWGAPGGTTSQGGSLFAPAPPDWWGPDLKFPNSTGAQNGARYAYFAQARRLAVEAGGSVFIYDTLDHQISGFSQQQGPNGSMSCTSQYGTVALNSLPVVSINGVAQVAPQHPTAAWNTAAVPMSTSNAAPAGVNGDVLGTIQKLADLHAAGVLSADEFSAKKAELLARL